MGRPTKDTKQVTVRVPSAWLTRADKVARFINPPGASFGRADALRAAIVKGLEFFEAEMRKGSK